MGANCPRRCRPLMQELTRSSMIEDHREPLVHRETPSCDAVGAF